MKKLTFYCLFFLAIGNWDMGLAQSSSASNTPAVGNFLGWTGGTAQSLIIKNNAAQPIYFQNAAGGGLRNRILIDDASSGRTAIGYNLSNGFTPQERLHLHHSTSAGSEVYVRFTNNDTDSSAEDGVNVGITQTEFRLTQYEDDYMSFQTPKNLITTGPTVQNRLRLRSNGQFLIGTASITDENIIDEDAISSFTNSYRSSLLNVRGPINSCYPSSAGTTATILYGYTSPFNASTASGLDGGFRMKVDFDFFDTGLDALVLEKTDGNSTTVDGGIAFTTTGSGGTEIPAMYIRGTGRTYVGRNLIASESSLLNRFVIDSESGDASKSGLRFVDLIDTETPVSNTGAGVLSVDADGNVVYVTAGTGSGSGYGLCGDANGVLSGDSKIELNENNFYFDVSASSTEATANKVGVGYECNDALPAKLSVYQNVSGNVSPGTIAGSFINADVANSGSGEFIGVFGTTNGAHTDSPPSSIRNIGGKFTAENASTNIGVHGEANDDKQLNYGGYFSGAGATTNYGVYATAAVAGTNRAGYFAGDLQTTSASVITSDKMFKQNVSKEKSALELLAKLSPVTYEMKIKDFPQFNFSNKKQHGFIAQEIETVLPELVHESYHPETLDENGKIVIEGVSYKSVNYNGLISINTQAINELNQKVEEKDALIKEQEKKIEDLNNRLSQLENCLSALLPALCQMNQSAIEQNTPQSQQALKEQLQTILSDRNTIVLTQNVPNPFAETTTIEYNIPATVAQAQIHFYDAQGKLIRSVDIATRGNGELKVFANDLSKGTYTYNLVADGKIVATKKMMKL